MSFRVQAFALLYRELSDRFSKELGRHNYVTPTSYLELISSFKSLLANKRGEVLKMKKRYEVGLQKLEFAASQVSPRHITCDSMSRAACTLAGGHHAEGAGGVAAQAGDGSG